MLISDPLNKLQKTDARKVITKKMTENGISYFYYFFQKFSAYNSF